MEIQRVLLDRDPGRPGARHHAGGPVANGDVVQIDERLEVLIADVAPGNDERMVRIVSVEELVVTGRLVRILGRCQRQVQPHILRPEKLGGQIDEDLVHDKLVQACALERELRPRCVPGSPQSGSFVVITAIHLGRRGEHALESTLGCIQVRRRNGALEHTPTVTSPCIEECRRKTRATHDPKLLPSPRPVFSRRPSSVHIVVIIWTQSVYEAPVRCGVPAAEGLQEPHSRRGLATGVSPAPNARQPLRRVRADIASRRELPSQAATGSKSHVRSSAGGPAGGSLSPAASLPR